MSKTQISVAQVNEHCSFVTWTPGTGKAWTLDWRPNYTRVGFVKCCDENIENYNITYNVYKSLPKKKGSRRQLSSSGLGYLIFTLHIACKHIKPIPDGMPYINQAEFPIYIFTGSVGKKKMDIHTGLMGGSAMCLLHQTDFINKVKTNWHATKQTCGAGDQSASLCGRNALH